MALMAAALSGATASTVLFSDFTGNLHGFLHQHEVWILVVSTALVGLGGWLELNARRQHRHGFPWLFAFSVFCLIANVTIIFAHRAI
ncbi:MAG: hypothetical protein AB7T59_13905 [Hyphomonadaceae bacterium]